MSIILVTLTLCLITFACNILMNGAKIIKEKFLPWFNGVKANCTPVR